MAKKASTPAPATRTSAKRRIRKIFGDIHEVVKMPNLIEVQQIGRASCRERVSNCV